MITLISIKHTKKNEKELKDVLYRIKPEVVCVELDEFRYRFYKGELSENEVKEYYKDMPIIFYLFMIYKKKLERESNTDWDWYLKVIFDVAREMKYEIRPIDKDQKTVYSEINRKIKFSKKMKIFFDILLQNFKRQGESADLKHSFEEKYPFLKVTLIDERDKYMANEIKKICSKAKEVVAIVGNGHIPGISSMIKESNPRIITFYTREKYSQK